MKSDVAVTPADEKKCIELIQTQLAQIKTLLESSGREEDILEQIASIRFAIRSVESTLMEKKMQAQLLEVFEESNQIHRNKLLQAI